MKQSFSYTQRLALLTLLIGLLVGVGLRMGSKTAKHWRAYRALQPQLTQLEHAPALLQQQQRQIEAARVVFHRQQARLRVGSHLAFVNYLSDQCKRLNLNVVSLPLVDYEPQVNYRLAHEVFRVEGSYQHILQLIYAIEQTDQLGRISQVRFEKQRHLLGGKRQTYLVAHCTLIRFEAKPS